MRPSAPQHVTPRDRPLYLPDPQSRHRSFSKRSILIAAAITTFIAVLWLGAVIGSAWVTSHPCLTVPGSVITGLPLSPLGPLGENRQDIACGLDGRVKWATIYISAEKVKEAE